VSQDLIPKYFERATGQWVTEKVAHPKMQQWIATSRIVRLLLNALFNRSWYCRLYGKWVDRSASRKNVQRFIKDFGIGLVDMDTSVDRYPNLNAFFSRKLKPGARPFVHDPSVFCSPGDGKILVYPQLTERTHLPIKGSHVDITALLASESDARVFHGGSACVLRLAPYDYHRYHFPVAGSAGEPVSIDGRYYLVNPLALSIKPDLFCHNKRTVTYVQTEKFGRFAYLEVAGFAVGRIIQTHTPGQVAQGQEKGYFQFGGSTLVLLFEPDKINFDQDLISHTLSGTEVQVRTGTQIGTQRM
jgi:phosphatidylserine decarboxylase